MKKLQRISLKLLPLFIALCGVAMSGGAAHALGPLYWQDQPIGGGQVGDCDLYDTGSTNPICNSGERIQLVSGQTQYVQQTGTKVRAYFTKNYGTVRVNNINYCEGYQGDQLETEDQLGGGIGGGSNQIPAGTTVVNVTATWPGNSVTQSGTAWIKGNDACKTIKTLSLSGLPQLLDDSGRPTGLYYATISADYVDNYPGGCSGVVIGGCDGIQDAFTLEEDDNDNYVIATVGDKSDGGQKGYKTTAQQLQPTQGHTYVTYIVRFGTPCDINQTQSIDFNFYDLDNWTSGGSANDAQYGDTIQVGWYKINSDGSIPSQPMFPLWTPQTLKNTTQTFSHNGFDPGQRYVFEIKHVYRNNTIQFSTPFDGIYYYKPCDSGGNALVSPHTTVTPGPATVGQTVTASGFISSDQGDSDSDVGVTRKFWYDDGDGTYNAANDQMIQQFTDNGTPRHVPAHGQYKGFDDWTAPAKLGGNISKMCESINIDKTDPNTDVHLSPSVTCILIGKSPDLHLQNGDLRTGGSFPASNNAPCSVKAYNAQGGDSGDNLADFSVIGHNYGGASTIGSYGLYGIFSTGRVINFGSSGAAATTGDISKYLTFANTKYAGNNFDGYFYSRYEGSTTAGTVVTTHCFTNVMNGRYPTGNPTPIANGQTVHSSVTSSGADSYNFIGSNGKLIIDSGTVPKDAQRVIQVNNKNGGTGNIVQIDGNVTYASGTYTDIKDLPEFVLLVNDSQIATRVVNAATELDGIYGVAGNFYTCDAFDNTAANPVLGINDACNNQLKVYGTLMVGGQAYPYRTAGQDNESDTTPAENFDLRPDVLLGDYAWGVKAGGLSTVYQTELPPRF